MMRAPQPVALLATMAMHLLLVLVYFVIFTPVAVLLRALRADPIGPRREAPGRSYWRPRGPGVRR